MPRTDGFSPAFGFFGRNIRGPLPDARSPESSLDEFATARQHSRDYSIKATQGQDLPPLSPGDSVSYQSPFDGNWSIGGLVLERHEKGRSYIIRTSGGDFRRNRRYLRISSTPMPVPPINIGTMASDLPRRSSRIRANRKVAFKIIPNIFCSTLK